MGNLFGNFLFIIVIGLNILDAFLVFGFINSWGIVEALVGKGGGFLVFLVFLQLLLIQLGTYLYYGRGVHALKSQIAFFLTEGSAQNRFTTRVLNPEITYINTFLQKSLEILKKFKGEMMTGRALRSEVELAAEIQKHVLARKKVSVPWLDIVANTKSATEVGGDSYDIIPRDDNYYIYLGDVTGHGVASGFVMMIVNALISGFSKMEISGASILAKTNEIVKPRVKNNMLMTLLMMRYNAKERKFFMTGAGHEYLIVYKHRVGKTVKLQSGGIALGMTKDISKVLKEVELAIEPGDIIVMYTDGITEARNSQGKDFLMFGVQRIIDAVNTSNKTAQGVFNTISIELSRFMGYNHKQYDDITLIVIQYTDGTTTHEAKVDAEIPEEFITEWNW